MNWAFSAMMSLGDVACLVGLWMLWSHRFSCPWRHGPSAAMVVTALGLTGIVWTFVIHSHPHPWFFATLCPVTGAIVGWWRYHRDDDFIE
ncbi:hypothetical protein [Sulfobacillus harzensis]|uniref:Uncharacterized protein n=1 Tax=Sulfobacillus harzensis TaxID=2729629 RepID=A0A7Y0L9M4_9FIRM|nr:hypothetical protein [Sulfobacillus harzensis]NMP24489.1 hypothetical protein [Sulfobacillus harzensis]